MARGKRYSAEQIIQKLREADVLIGQGVTIKEVSRRLGVTGKMYYRWRSEYGWMKWPQAGVSY